MADLQLKVEETVRVLCLTHSYFVDTRPMNAGKAKGEIQFLDANVPHPEGEMVDGEVAMVVLGMAHVPMELYEEFYGDHPSFQRVEDYMASVRKKIAAAENKGAEITLEVEEKVDDAPEPITIDEDPFAESPNPLHGVDFRSDNAAELAMSLGLSAADFVDVRPGGSGKQYVVPDVRRANKAKIAASKQ